MANIFFVVDLLSLRLLNFRFIIMYFGILRMHQNVPFLSILFGGACPQDP